MPDSYAGSPVVAREELRSMRGGLAIAGLDIQFGATVRTMVNGSLAAETILTLTDNGTLERQTTFLDGAVLRPVAGDLANLPSSRIEAAALKDATGFVLNDPTGVTAALNDVTLQHASNIVINTVPGHDIQQFIDMQLTIQNFGQISTALHADMLAGRLAQAGQIDPMLSGAH
jgi:hypothetical protein